MTSRINDVTQIWPKIDWPTPFATQKCLFYLHLKTKCHKSGYPRPSYLCDVIYESSLSNTKKLTAPQFLTKLQLTTVDIWKPESPKPDYLLPCKGQSGLVRKAETRKQNILKLKAE